MFKDNNKWIMKIFYLTMHCYLEYELYIKTYIYENRQTEKFVQ